MKDLDKNLYRDKSQDMWQRSREKEWVSLRERPGLHVKQSSLEGEKGERE